MTRSCGRRFSRTALFVAFTVPALLLASPAPGVAGDAASPHKLFAKTLLPLHDRKGGATIATVTPGTAFAVQKRAGAKLLVAVTGWSPVGGESLLFKALGQRILLARLTRKGVATRKVLKEKEDEYGSPWQRVRITGWVARRAVVADVEKVWKRASRLFHKRCTRCHALHRPTEFTANQWPNILKIMTKRAGLSKARKALVVKYLQTHAKDQDSGS